MNGSPYQQGNPVTLEATFFVDTTPTDPTTVTFNIRNPDNTITTLVYLTDGQVTRIAEGTYECALGIPAQPGQYHYDAVGTGACEATLPGEFFVIPSSVTAPDPAPGPVLGPNQAWISAADVAGACNGLDPEDPNANAAAIDATQILWEKSGRQFTGLSQPLVVRPMLSRDCGCWAGDFTWGGYTWVWLDAMAGWAWSAESGDPLYGCGYVSRIKLAGYPIREILEVKIGGDVLPATYDGGAPRYRLDQWRYLTRMSDPDTPQITAQWPSCQNLTLDDNQPGTFSVKYTYGVDPPQLGIDAAKQLACQIALALDGKDCQLPAGATKITRNGVVIERGVLAQWGRDPKTGSWNTGLVLVDAFLNTYNPVGLRRRPAIIDPSRNPYAPALGEQ